MEDRKIKPIKNLFMSEADSDSNYKSALIRPVSSNLAAKADRSNLS